MDTLTVTDNRTGKTYEIPVKDGTIRAIDLRQIKTSGEDFGLMSYDPAFMNTAHAKAALHSSTATAGYCATAAIP
jgi:citrate synthase